MSRKDFILIAGAIRNLRVDANTRQHVAETFADELSDNSKTFKRDLFVQAATFRVELHARKALPNRPLTDDEAERLCLEEKYAAMGR